MNSFINLTRDQQQWITVIGELICVFHGGFELLAPRKFHKFYKGEDLALKKEETELHVVSILQQDGLACLTGPIVWFLVTFKDLSVEEAIGVSAIPWLVLMIHFLLNDLPQRVGNSVKGVLVNIAVFSFVVWATIFETAYADLAVKILAGFALFHAVPVLLVPNFHAVVWGNVQSDEDTLHFARRCLGCDLIPVGVYFWALISGVPTLKAGGMAWASVFVGFLTLLSGFKSLKYDMTMIYLWIVMMAFFAFTLTIDISEQDTVVESIKEGIVEAA